MEVINININKLKLNNGQIKDVPKNPRFIKDDRFAKLKKSIEDFPEMLQYREIICYDNDGELVIVGGNMRFRACKELGYKEVPVKILPKETDAKRIREFIIKDNVSFGNNDIDILNNEFDEIELEDWGIELEELGMDMEPEIIEDDFEVPEVNKIKTDIVRGDLFEIYKNNKLLHKVLCGDSTNIDDVKKLIGEEKADMVFTDPPYGINVVQGGKVGGGKIAKAKNYSKIIGDGTTDTAKEFYQTCISLGMGNFIIWGGNYFTDFLNPSMCWVIWDKENTGNFADVEMAWSSFKKGAKLYRWQWNGMIRKGNKNIEGKTRVHPTQKPIGLFMNIFNDFLFNICFDGFLGSGSTLIASHQLNRRCYGIEISEQYCQVILNRIYKLDNGIIIKRNGINETNKFQ